MDFEHSEKTKDYLKRLKSFINEKVAPVEKRFHEELRSKANGGDWTKWKIPPYVEELKEEAKKIGLWNLFIDHEGYGGLSNVEYAPLAEEMGKSELSQLVCNCNAPDTGNMEVLIKYGTEQQKEQWLKPLMDGKIRSVFCMTEPAVASSDATNMEATAIQEGDEIVINGRKWWSSNIGHPDCKIIVFMGLTYPEASRHSQHSMVLVPVDAEGVKIERMLSVFGEFHEPHGHGEVSFNNVRVPKENFILGPGRGFEIAQGRLGPGRIHHCMRSIGAAELALELMIKRGMERTAFGKPIINLGGNRERIADLRIAIDQARLLTLRAAWKVDKFGGMAAVADVSAIKVIAPNVLQRVADEAIQIFGGAGVSQDTPLAHIFANGKIMRIFDGPDAVHRGLVARIELAKYK